MPPLLRQQKAQRLRRRVRRPVRIVPRASVSKARAATTTIAATNSIATRATATRAAIATSGARDKGRDFGGRDKGGRDKRDSGPSHRQWATSAAPRERDRPVDPNSPFAKLAALKEQLAGNARNNASNSFERDYLERQRLDKWLWHARVVKARTSAAALVEAGHVRINGVREKSPGHAVKIGDVLTIALDRTVRILKVAGFSERRGDATAARVLYDDLQNGKE